MRAIDSQCRGCPVRNEGCHSLCPLYQEYQKDRQKVYEKKHNSMMLDSYFSSKIIDTAKRRDKGKHYSLAID